MKDQDLPENQLHYDNPHKEKLPTLTNVVARYIALILIIGMASYAVLQYVLRPEVSIMGLIREHVTHIFFLMILIYVTLYMFFLKVVVAPIHHFQEKLYAISGGDLLPLSRNYRIREIRDIADGINLMIERISVDLPESSISSLSAHASTLREIATSSESLMIMQKEALLDAANEMSHMVAASTKNIIHDNEVERRRRV